VEGDGSDVTMATNEARAEEQDVNVIMSMNEARDEEQKSSGIMSMPDVENSHMHSAKKHDGDDVSIPNKRRKWMTKEIVKLIEARKQREVEVLLGQGTRKGLWKRVSECLAEEGYVRNPDQCKTVWFSLVKKYKVRVCDLCLL
jgi:hypothetical protein